MAKLDLKFVQMFFVDLALQFLCIPIIVRHAKHRWLGPVYLELIACPGVYIGEIIPTYLR
jgi:hypothetical protein